jgi:hypothetical protein
MERPMSDPTEELQQDIFETILDLSRVDVLSLFTDICAFRGWDTEIAIGDPDVIGDVVAVQQFPVYQSISVFCYSADLTVARLEQDVESFRTTESAAMVALIQHPPTDEVMSFAEEHGVTFVDPTELTAQLLELPAPEILSEYVDPETLEAKFDEYQADVVKSTLEAEIGSGLEFTPSAKSEDGVTAGVLGVAPNVDVTTILGPHVNNKNVTATVVLWEVINDMETSIDGWWETDYVLDDGMDAETLNLQLSDTWTDDQWKVSGKDSNDVPETHPGSKTRWIDVLNIPDGKELAAAVLHSGNADSRILIRLPISDAQVIAEDSLPF